MNYWSADSHANDAGRTKDRKTIEKSASKSGWVEMVLERCVVLHRAKCESRNEITGEMIKEINDMMRQ